MKMNSKLFTAVLGLFLSSSILAQDAMSYQMPPKAIADLLLAKPTPSVSIDSKANWILLSERNSYPTVEELGQPEIRIAGLRLNPNNYSPSRQTYVNNFVLKNIQTKQVATISGLPATILASNISWNPSETKIAFTNTNATNIDLYVIDIATKKAVKINKQAVNTVLGSAFIWLDDQTIL